MHYFILPDSLTLDTLLAEMLPHREVKMELAKAEAVDVVEVEAVHTVVEDKG